VTGRIWIYISILFFVFLLCGSAPVNAQVSDTVTIEEAVDDEYTADDENEPDTDHPFTEKVYRDAPPEPDHRQVPSKRMEEIGDQKAFWYANTEFEKPKEKFPDIKPYVPITQRDWFQTLLWLVIIGSFAAVLMIYLTGNRVGLFRKKPVVIDEGGEEIMPEDIFAINYQREIDRAESQGNYRLAIRMMYLRLLKNFSDRQIIRYSQDKTNFDYLLQLHGTKYYEDFFRVTRNYEYSWYGKFDINEQAYRIVRKDFDQIERKITW